MATLPVPPDEHETLEMVSRLREGDEHAWRELYRRYRDELLFAIRCRLGPRLRSALQSEDVLQSAALEAFRAMPSFEDRGPGSLGAFLHKLVVHKVLDRARTFGAQKRRGAVPLSGTVVEGHAGTEPLSGYRDARYERLERCLQRLPEAMREVVALRRIEGLSSKEVAAKTGRSDAAVRKLYSRSMAKLSLMVEGAGA